MQNVINPLGTFNHTYVNATGRLDHVDLPHMYVAITSDIQPTRPA